MPTTMTQKSRYFRSSKNTKNYPQTLSLMVGSFTIVIGLAGILTPSFMGLHLSLMHTFVLLASGILSVWGATSTDTRRVFRIDLLLGIFFAINAVAGILLGAPGNPSVGFEGYDEMLVKIAPGFIELGTVDHGLHALLAFFYFTGAISWKRHHHGHKNQSQLT